MKNIILQHWDGELSPLCKASVDNICKYAKKVGSYYQLIRGKPFRPNLSPQCQKLFMLDKEFDEYEFVVMLDTDMFVRKGMTEDIFKVPGIGMHTSFQSGLFSFLGKKFPHLYDPKYPFWGGAIYKTDKEVRRRFRECYREDEMQTFSDSSFVDEGIMHRLATLAKFSEKSYLPGEFKWCHCSYREGIENASFIHVRTKITSKKGSPKRPKIENYKRLISAGLIEE